MKARALTLATAVFAGLIALGSQAAQADMSAKVIKAFKGQIIVSEGPLLEGNTDKETIAAYKAQRLKVVTGELDGDDATAWQFHYTAFLKKKGITNLVLEFHTGGNYVADQRLNGVDPTLTVLETDIAISENDGPSKDKDYTLKLVGMSKGKEVVLASTTVRLE